MLNVYDPEAVFLNRSGRPSQGLENLRAELRPFAEAKPNFEFTIVQIIEARDTALMHTKWKVSAPQEISVYAIEVARRQPDGTWRWLIGDPFTVGEHATS